MNYRHSYHAGSFADVFKHVVLVALIQSLLRKETPFCYLETHAGIGCYDLFSEASQKNLEFENGIKKILTANDPPSLIQDYLSCVKQLNQSNELRYYPGSPYFAKHWMRLNDRIVLSELHQDDAKTLKKFFAEDKRVAVHHQDGYQSLKAFLPPKERRGLVLIDPAYEKNEELMSLPGLLAQTLKRWETGIYAIWYPIKTKQQNKLFQQELKTKIERPFLSLELCIYSQDVAHTLNGSGMIIINPPWQIDQQLKNTVLWLWNALSPNEQGYVGIF
jgi:23S rRNA (adenine2030-N6)-methyltransferase